MVTIEGDVSIGGMMVLQGLDERNIVEDAKEKEERKEEVEDEDGEGIARWTAVAESLKGSVLMFVRVREWLESRRR